MKLSRQLYEKYVVATAYDNYGDEVVVFNKIIKDLITNTSIISTVPKSYYRLF